VVERGVTFHCDARGFALSYSLGQLGKQMRRGGLTAKKKQDPQRGANLGSTNRKKHKKNGRDLTGSRSPRVKRCLGAPVFVCDENSGRKREQNSRMRIREKKRLRGVA